MDARIRDLLSEWAVLRQVMIDSADEYHVSLGDMERVQQVSRDLYRKSESAKQAFESVNREVEALFNR